MNRDLDLQTAFALSAVPHYQRLVRLVGGASMHRYLENAGHGNVDRSGGGDRVWLEHGGLRISPREQVRMLVRLANGELPFSEHALSTVRRIMINPEAGSDVLRAKTGWVQCPGGRQVGWWVGWVERDKNRWFFATVLESAASNPDFCLARAVVTREVLKAIGVLP